LERFKTSLSVKHVAMKLACDQQTAIKADSFYLAKGEL